MNFANSLTLPFEKKYVDNEKERNTHIGDINE
ncbi:protein of unknown function [Methanocaldococcus lauensis]|uniref:Uncharacterized protein n=1 Tax=Methanocaldococcus lauensis TaxID=2546128 RepID=A0A8D6SXJ3_9EURY|nr:protein of unknown function [Methanocaldococcus lauensis]